MERVENKVKDRKKRRGFDQAGAQKGNKTETNRLGFEIR